ncbi:MAG: hypothetical protein CL945_04580 [Dinoroseobacter sp.]|jgi:hypothetical protein|nr:hypothetical protein [Dinoroseobacter sp.]|tara:strand:+ start:488 stop:1033 length:546 start_codon:yes stop_codon:yes gene_type:complete
MTEVWVSLDVYGPQSEIERFRKLCLAPALRGANVKGALDIVRVVRDLADSEPTSTAIAWFGEAWNLREDAQESTGSFGCGFDMTEFHEELFHCLAREFPALAFHCGCIGSDNEFMGYGWFNGPGTSEAFACFDMPDEYWTARAQKPDPLAHLLHERRVAAMQGKALLASLAETRNAVEDQK